MRRVKRKYLIYDNTGKILIYENDKKFVFPTTIDNTFGDKQNNIHNKIIMECLGGQSPMYLHEDIDVENIQGEALDYEIHHINRYYGMYHEFTEQNYSEIYKLAMANNVIPHMATIDEIKDLMLMDQIDSKAIDAILILEKRFFRKR